MIAVDVNIIAYLLIAGEKTAEARLVRELDDEWIVPDLWRDEFMNILATYIRQDGTRLESARSLWVTAAGLFENRERSADSIATLELAEMHRLSAYDAQYLAVAVEFGVPLITEDRSLLRSTPKNTMTMAEYIALVTKDSALSPA